MRLDEICSHDGSTHLMLTLLDEIIEVLFGEGKNAAMA